MVHRGFDFIPHPKNGYVIGLKEDGNLGFDDVCFRQGGEGDVEINLGLSR